MGFGRKYESWLALAPVRGHGRARLPCIAAAQGAWVGLAPSRGPTVGLEVLAGGTRARIFYWGVFFALWFFFPVCRRSAATGRLYPCCNRPRVSRVLAAFGFAGQRSGGGRWARADVAWIFLFVFFLLFLVGFRRACGPESRGERWQALYLAVRYCVSMCAYRLANSRPHVVFSLYF